MVGFFVDILKRSIATRKVEGTHYHNNHFLAGNQISRSEFGTLFFLQNTFLACGTHIAIVPRIGSNVRKIHLFVFLIVAVSKGHKKLGKLCPCNRASEAERAVLIAVHYAQVHKACGIFLRPMACHICSNLLRICAKAQHINEDCKY